MLASTHDQDVFGFYPDERFCNGFEEVLHRYREIVPQLRLAGSILVAAFKFLATILYFQPMLTFVILMW